MGLKQKIRFCTSRDGVRIAFATSGKGTPIVKVGNWLTHLEYEVGSPVWGNLVEGLSDGHTVVRYDQRGTGLSDWDVASMTFDDWIADLEQVVEAAGLDKFALLGISQGAAIAIEFAARFPDRVTHLLIHGGYARGRRRRNSPAMIEESETMAKLIELGWGRDDPAFRQFFTTQFIPGGTSEQHQWFNELERVSASGHTAARILRIFDDVDVTPRASRVTCPTLVLHATHDRRVPFDEGRLIAGLIEEARFVPLDSANHLMLAQDPTWSRWFEEVRDFIGTSTSEAPPEFSTLTRRERELVELIAQGRDNAQIGAVMGLTDKTVRNHITSVFSKLDVENRAQAIVLARNAGFGAEA